MNNRIIVVLGGNAFVKAGKQLTMADQFEFAQKALKNLLPLFEDERQLVITHGNGPQVGHMLTRVEESLGKAYAIPLEVCVAESEGELGYVLEQSLYNLLTEQRSPRPIVSLLTQIVVDANDPAFQTPTKPVGPFYTETQAKELTRKGFAVHEDVDRGYRRVVASPVPREIIEWPVIDQLLNNGVLVIAAGGGGIPVVREHNRLIGVEAVIDKDLASALLGENLGAKLMLVITDVPCAYRHFGTPQQDSIGHIDVDQARQLIALGHFSPGSMLPKIEAGIKFASRPGAKTIICDLATIHEALQGIAGTIIENSILE